MVKLNLSNLPRVVFSEAEFGMPNRFVINIQAAGRAATISGTDEHSFGGIERKAILDGAKFSWSFEGGEVKITCNHGSSQEDAQFFQTIANSHELQEKIVGIISEFEARLARKPFPRTHILPAA